MFKNSSPYMVSNDGISYVLRFDSDKNVWLVPPNRTMTNEEFIANGFTVNEKIVFGEPLSEFPDVGRDPVNAELLIFKE